MIHKMIQINSQGEKTVLTEVVVILAIDLIEKIKPWQIIFARVCEITAYTI